MSSVVLSSSGLAVDMSSVVLSSSGLAVDMSGVVLSNSGLDRTSIKFGCFSDSSLFTS